MPGRAYRRGAPAARARLPPRVAHCRGALVARAHPFGRSGRIRCQGAPAGRARQPLGRVCSRGTFAAGVRPSGDCAPCSMPQFLLYDNYMTTI